MKKRKRKKRNVDLNQKCPRATDVTLLGLTYVDFWLTVSSIETECVATEFCQMAAEMAPTVLQSPIIKQIDAVLLYGAAFYLEQMNDKQLSSYNLSKATEYGRSHGTCDIFNIARCN